jgi:hypothetical protein
MRLNVSYDTRTGSAISGFPCHLRAALPPSRCGQWRRSRLAKLWLRATESVCGRQTTKSKMDGPQLLRIGAAGKAAGEWSGERDAHKLAFAFYVLRSQVGLSRPKSAAGLAIKRDTVLHAVGLCFKRCYSYSDLGASAPCSLGVATPVAKCGLEPRAWGRRGEGEREGERRTTATDVSLRGTCSTASAWSRMACQHVLAEIRLRLSRCHFPKRVNPHRAHVVTETHQTSCDFETMAQSRRYLPVGCK